MHDLALPTFGRFSGAGDTCLFGLSLWSVIVVGGQSGLTTWANYFKLGGRLGRKQT